VSKKIKFLALISLLFSNGVFSTEPQSGGIQGLGDPNRKRIARRVASEIKKRDRKPVWFLGPTLSFDGPLAKVESSSTLSKGLGFGAGLSLGHEISGVRISFLPCFRSLRLGRSIDGSGVLTDPTPTEFTQSIKYLGTGLMVSFWGEEGGGPSAPFDPSWWMDLGTEVLFPLSSEQTSNFVTNADFKAQRLWFLLIGASLDFEPLRNQHLKAGLHLFYNLPSTTEARLFGIRAQIAFDFGLL
jgi:hypothetical protein